MTPIIQHGKKHKNKQIKKPLKADGKEVQKELVKWSEWMRLHIALQHIMVM